MTFTRRLLAIACSLAICCSLMIGAAKAQCTNGFCPTCPTCPNGGCSRGICPTCPNGHCPCQQCPGATCPGPGAWQPQQSPPPQPAQNPPAAVVRVRSNCRDGRSTDAGSGTLISTNDRGQGIVITNWHVVKDGSGQVETDFPGGARCAGTVLFTDETWDVAAILITPPQGIAPLAIADDLPQPGEVLTIAGYGGAGQYRALAGHFCQFASPGQNEPAEFLEVDVAARHGDSGGPIFNARGELAGMLDAADDGSPPRSQGAQNTGAKMITMGADGPTVFTVGPCGKRLRKILSIWFPRERFGLTVGSAPPVAPGVILPPSPPPSYYPPEPAAPITQPSAPPNEQLGLNLSAQLGAIKTEVDSLLAGTNGSFPAINAQLATIAPQVASIPAIGNQLQTFETQANTQLAAINAAVQPAQLRTAFPPPLPAAPAQAAAAPAVTSPPIAAVIGGQFSLLEMLAVAAVTAIIVGIVFVALSRRSVAPKPAPSA